MLDVAKKSRRGWGWWLLLAALLLEFAVIIATSPSEDLSRGVAIATMAVGAAAAAWYGLVYRHAVDMGRSDDSHAIADVRLHRSTAPEEALWLGAARLMDVAGAMRRERAPSDWEAVASDWQAVSADYRGAQVRLVLTVAGGPHTSRDPRDPHRA